MTTSPTSTAPAAPIASLAAALVAAQAAASGVEKGSKNQHQGYKYASSEAIIEEARDALASAGLAVVRTSSSVVWSESAPDAKQRVGLVMVVYRLIHVSGEHIDMQAETPAVVAAGRPEDKAVATALTYSLGYFLRDLLLLPRVEEHAEVDSRDDRAYAPSAAKKAAPKFAPPADVDYAAEARKLVQMIKDAGSLEELDMISTSVRRIASAMPKAALDSVVKAGLARREALAPSHREAGEEG